MVNYSSLQITKVTSKIFLFNKINQLVGEHLLPFFIAFFKSDVYKKMVLNFYGGDAMSDVNKKIEIYKAMVEITTGKERKKWMDKVYYYENRNKISEKEKDRYQKNKEEKKQRTRSYYEKNKEKINEKRRSEVKSEEFKQKERERLRKYKQENRDYVNKKSREWCEQNKDKRKQIQKKYRIKNALKIKDYRDNDDYRRKHFIWSKEWIDKNSYRDWETDRKSTRLNSSH